MFNFSLVQGEITDHCAQKMLIQWQACIRAKSRFSRVWLTLCDSMDYSCQAPLSMGFFRQEYWSGLPCPPPGDFPNTGVEPVSPAWQEDSLPTQPPGKHACSLSNLDEVASSSKCMTVYSESTRIGTLLLRSDWPYSIKLLYKSDQNITSLRIWVFLHYFSHLFQLAVP